MILLGQNLQLYVGGKSIAFAKSHTVDITVDTVDVSTKDHGGYENSEAGLIHWNMSSENLLANTRSGLGYDDLFDLMLAKQPVEVVFGVKDSVIDRNDPYDVPAENGWPVPTKHGYKGKALITSLSCNATNGEATSMTVQLTGVSALVKIAVTGTAQTMSLRSTSSVASVPASASSK